MTNICEELFQIVTRCRSSGGHFVQWWELFKHFFTKRATESEQLALSDPGINSIRQREGGETTDAGVAAMTKIVMIYSRTY